MGTASERRHRSLDDSTKCGILAHPVFEQIPYIMSNSQRTSQKIAFAVAILCYMAAVGCMAATAYYASQLGSESPIVAAFSASIVFFAGAGIVLHVIGKSDLPDLRIK